MHTFLQRRRLAAVAVASIAAMTLAACGSSGAESQNSASASDQAGIAAAKANVKRLEQAITD
jgi:hypothetical protein